jgi:hypothetical protein
VYCPDSLVAGDTVTATVTFTTVGAIPLDGKIKVTFGANFDLTGVTTGLAGDATCSTMDGTFTTGVSGQIVTITRAAGTAALGGEIESCTIANVVNPPITGSTGLYTVETTSSGDVQVDVDAAVAADTITAGVITSANVAPRFNVASTSGTTTVTFTTANPLPNDGFIYIEYPAGFDIAGVADAECSNLDDTLLTVSDNGGQEVLIERDGLGTAEPAGAFTCTYNGVENPGTTGAAGAYAIVTATAGDVDIDSKIDVTSDTMRALSGGSSSSNITTETTYFNDDGEIIEEEEATEEETTTEEDSTTEAVEFSDTSDHWADTEVTAMVEAGVITGYDDGTFKPENDLLRSEAAALLYRVLGIDEPAAPEADPFTDVDAGSWYAGYIAYLESIDVVTGNPDGTYQPAETINRAEFLTLALNTYYYLGDETLQEAIDTAKAAADGTEFADVDGKAWFVEVAGAAKELGFVQGYSCGENKCFNADNNITRAEATTILYNMFSDMLMPAESTEAVESTEVVDSTEAVVE